MIRKNLIGREVEIIQAENPTLEGKKGEITDETKNTLVLKTEEGKKRIIKDQVKLKIGNTTVSGKKIKRRIEDRIKKGETEK